MQESSKKPIITTTIIILIVVTLLVAGAVWANNEKNTSQQSTSQNTSKTSSSNNQEEHPLKDGTYHATGHYVSPGGEQALKVTVTLKDGVITDTSAQPDNKSPTSLDYQTRFISGYKNIVLGKKPSEVKIDHVSGSSLTSGGFKDALHQIEDQATS